MTGLTLPESDAEKLQRRNRELSILNAIAGALNQSIDLEQALQAALAQAAVLLGLRTGWIWLLHEETGESYLAAAQNLPPALANNPRKMEGSCYCLDTYRAGDLRGAANVNVVTCSRLSGVVDGTEGLRCHASVPLYAHEKRLGVLNLASADWRELSAEDLRLLKTVGDLLSMAIERARLYARSIRLGTVEERNRLARELHDTLAQGLAAVALQLETADALLEERADPEQARERIRGALAQTRASLEDVRRSVLDLRAAPLEGRTLADALAALAEEASARPNLSIEFGATGRDHLLPLRHEAGLFRIAQEALANALQHAGAHRVTLRLETTSARVRLVIADDGRGFEPACVAGDRYGLIGMSERAKLLGGRLKLRSSPGKGTRVEVIVPLGAGR